MLVFLFIWQSHSSAKHIEEIREAGLEMPAVNQVEVSISTRLRHGTWSWFCHQLHPMCQQKPIVEYCNQHNIVVQAYTPLLRGAFDNPLIQELAAKVTICTLCFSQDINSSQYSKDAAQILIRWSLQRGWACLVLTRLSHRHFYLPRFVPLPKSSNPQRIISNSLVFDWNIEPMDMAKLDALDRGKDGAVTWNPVDVE